MRNHRPAMPKASCVASKVWTADGRPRPAVTRTLQYAADIASCRNGQHMSSQALQRRWKHEIQIALLRRRAAVTRAAVPNISARERWLLAGLIDRATTLDSSSPHSMEEKTKTQAQERTPQHQTARNRSTRAPVGASNPGMDQHAPELENLFDDNSVSYHTVTNSLNLEHVKRNTQQCFLPAPLAVPQVANKL